MSKTLKTWQMPYLMKYACDGELVSDTDDIAVDVTPNNLKQLYAISTDYLAGPFPIESEESRSILVNAGLLSE